MSNKYWIVSANNNRLSVNKKSRVKPSECSTQVGVAAVMLLTALLPAAAAAAQIGLPFTENFSSSALMDALGTTANWSTVNQTISLPPRTPRENALTTATTVGADITTDRDFTIAIAVGDVNGDGHLDQLAGNSNQINKLYLGNGDGTFQAASNISADTFATSDIQLGDLDKDGDLDIVEAVDGAVNYIYLNNGDGTFSAAQALAVDGDNTAAIALGDMDGDGDLDVVAGNYSMKNRLYLNNGDGSFAAGTDISSDILNTFALALADLNDDGRLDIVAGNFNKINRFYLNNGTSAPFDSVAGIDVNATDADRTTSLALADVNGDGAVDIVVGNANGTVNRLYLNNQDNSFSAATNLSSDANDTVSISLADIDSDGDLDVVASNVNNQLNRVYLNDGSATPFIGVSGQDLTADADNSYAAVLVDLNHDAIPDLLVGNDGVNRVYLNNASVVTPDPNQNSSAYNLSANLAGSLVIDNAVDPIDAVLLNVTETLPLNTGVTYYLTNNNGGNWYQVTPGTTFVFPVSGSALQWRAQLQSLSPYQTPLISQLTLELDLDRDNIGNSQDPDDDNDGITDDVDLCPLGVTGWISNASTDNDADGCRDSDEDNDEDNDDDNDGVLDTNDAFPLDASESVDTDGDGTGNNADTDDDGDGMLDQWELDNGLDPLDASDASQDADGDDINNLQEFTAGSDPQVAAPSANNISSGGGGGALNPLSLFLMLSGLLLTSVRKVVRSRLIVQSSLMGGHAPMGLVACVACAVRTEFARHYRSFACAVRWQCHHREITSLRTSRSHALRGNAYGNIVYDRV